MDEATQHLEAAAEAQHETAAPGVGLQVDIPALAAQRREIGHCGFRARDNDQPALGGDDLARIDEGDGDTRFVTQRVEIIEIGDARQAKNRNPAMT